MSEKLWWERTGLEYNNDSLNIGGVEAITIANKFGTPTYVYDSARFVDNFNRISNALNNYADREIRIDYAMKANSSFDVLRLLRENGCKYIDVTSPGEARIAIAAGYKNNDVMFTGTSVSDKTLEDLLRLGVFINVDSSSELRRLHHFHPDEMEISVRWNPGIGAGAYGDTITAGKEVKGKPIKFGIEEEKMEEFVMKAKSYGKKVVGLHQHIGSGWKGADVNIFLETVDKTLAMERRIQEITGSPLRFVDFGGGPGIRYKKEDREFPIDVYAKGICDKVKESVLDFEAIEVEPGRYIVGDAGILLTEVNTVEEKNGNLIIGIDAGMHTLIRPKLYGAHHEIIPIKRNGNFGISTVAGPICETGDLLAIKRYMEIPEEGDYLAFLCAGAYGYEMASNYNMWGLPERVIISDGNFKII